MRSSFLKYNQLPPHTYAGNISNWWQMCFSVFWRHSFV